MRKEFGVEGALLKARCYGLLTGSNRYQRF